MGKAMVDAARLADELRAEQDHASAQASSKQSLNNQFGQLEARLSDAENAAARGGKAAMAELESQQRLTSALSASARSSPSLPVRTRRTRTGWLRRSPPSTWPSSGRPSRSWRRSRSAPSLLPSSKTRWTTDLRQLKLEEKLTKSGTLRQHPHTVKIQKLPRRRLQTPDIKLCFPKPPGCRPWSSFSTLLISVSSPTINA